MPRLVPIVAIAALLSPPLLCAEPAGSPSARRSLALCAEAARRGEAERVRMLEEGLALGDAAVAADPDDPAAHFGVFCNLGRRIELEGLSIRSLRAVRRLRAEVDAALVLAPEDPDVLAAKGAFLVNLPALFGGDLGAGEALLRQALGRDPDNCAARSYLARALASRGAAGEAQALRRGCRAA